MKSLIIFIGLMSVFALADYKTRPFCHGTDKVNGVYSDGALRCSPDLGGDGGVVNNYWLDGGSVTNNYWIDGGVTTVEVEALIAEQARPDWIDRTVIDCTLTGPATTGMSCSNGGNPTCGTGCTNGNTADRQYIAMTTTAVATAAAGYSAPATYAQIRWAPRLRGYFSTGDITSARYWYGLTTGGLGAVSPTTAASATTLLALSYDAAVGSNWICCYSNGVTRTCTAMASGPAASTDYVITLDARTSTGSCKVHAVLAGTDVTGTHAIDTTLSASLGFTATVTTSVASARSALVGRFTIDYN